MTKVVIKGPAAGTGSYTLNAPETASELSLEMPITGTHLASAQADGMPLGPGGDPVVESGSNSDGEWTKWADGTQITITIRKPHSTTLIDYTVPAVFVGTAYDLSVVTTTIPISSNSTSQPSNVFMVSLTEARVALPSTSSNETLVTSIGRWK